MKKIFLFSAVLSIGQSLVAQSVGIGTNAPHTSAMLDIISTNKGMLTPRMSTANRTGIANPATGLLVFDTDFGDFWYYNGSVWSEITTAATGTNYWTLASNNISNNNAGNVGVGINGASITEKFQVDANMKIGNGVWSNAASDRLLKFGDGDFVSIGESGQDDRLTLTGRNFIFTPSSTYPGYIGINTNAPSAPLSFGNFIGEKINFWNTDATHNYGIGVQGGLLQIHSNDATADIVFGSGNSASLNETMRIKGNGNVGIGTNNPGARLDINGTLKISDGTQGSNKVLTSDGSGNATWQPSSFGNNERFSFHNRYSSGAGASFTTNYNTGTCTGSNGASSNTTSTRATTIHFTKTGLYHFSINAHTLLGGTNSTTGYLELVIEDNISTRRYIDQNHAPLFTDSPGIGAFYDKEIDIYIDQTLDLTFTSTVYNGGTPFTLNRLFLTITGNLIAD